MEVYCSELNDAFPTGSVISIRAGTTRRQAPITALQEHSLKFPTVDSTEPLRIDVLKPMASDRLVLQPNQERYDVNLKQESGEPLKFAMQVKKRPDAGKVAEPADPISSTLKYKDAAGSARKYLEDHELLKYFQGLLQTVLQEKPEDPYGYMWEQIGTTIKAKRNGHAEEVVMSPDKESELRARIKAAEDRVTALTERAEAAEARVNELTPPAPQAAAHAATETPAAVAPAAEETPAAWDVGTSAAPQVAGAASDEDAKAQELRELMKVSLQKALETGIFEKVFKELQSSALETEKAPPPASAETPPPAGAAPPASDEAPAPTSAEATPPATAPPPAPPPPPPATAPLSNAGAPQVTVGAPAPAAPPAPTATAAPPPLVAPLPAPAAPPAPPATGEIGATTAARASDPQDLEAVKRQLREALTSAAELEQPPANLGKEDPESLEAVKTQLREALETAFVNGDLDSALQSSQAALDAESSTAAPSPASAPQAQSMAETAPSSSETAALATEAAAPVAQGTEAAPAPETTDLNQCSSEEIVNLKDQVRLALEQAMETGELFEWLQGVTEEPDSKPTAPPPLAPEPPEPPSAPPPPLPQEAKPEAPPGAPAETPPAPLPPVEPAAASSAPAEAAPAAEGAAPGEEKVVKRSADTKAQLSFLQARVDSLKQDSEQLHQQVSTIQTEMEEIKKLNDSVHQLIQSDPEAGFTPAPRVQP